MAEQYGDNKAPGGWLREHRPPPSYANAAYDPLVLSDGIEPSANDPVLAFRSGAYAVSWARRTVEAAAKP